MRYKVGDKVVLNGHYVVLGRKDTVKIDKIEGWDDTKRYVSNAYKRFVFDDDHIDHEKTAELNSDKALKHYSDELARVVAKKKKEAVNHPSHYNQGEYEAIDVIKDITRDYSGYEGYLVGNIIKYLYRANYKADKVEDLKKVQWHADELVCEVEK